MWRFHMNVGSSGIARIAQIAQIAGIARFLIATLSLLSFWPMALFEGRLLESYAIQPTPCIA